MAEKLEDLNLPNTVVTRLIKEALPEGQNSVVSKEARLALGKAASVFVLYVTSAATNVAKKSNRKTISAQDVIDAMNDLEFDNFVDPLKDALENFRQSQKEKKEANVKKKQQKVDEEVHDEEDNEIDDDDDVELEE